MPDEPTKRVPAEPIPEPRAFVVLRLIEPDGAHSHWIFVGRFSAATKAAAEVAAVAVLNLDVGESATVRTISAKAWGDEPSVYEVEQPAPRTKRRG